MQAAEGTTEELISSAREFLGDKSPAWETVRGVRGCKDDEKDAPDLPENAKLRPYQDACVLGTLAHWGSGQKVKVHPERSTESAVAKVVLPTGTGKSLVIAVLAVAMAKKEYRVLIVTPNQEIRAGLLSRLASTCEAMDDGDGDDSLKMVVLVARGAKGIYKGRGNFEVVDKLSSRDSKSAEIVVSNYQTLTRRFRDGDADSHNFQVVLVDEGHHIHADSYKKVLQECQPEFVCHLTATPNNYAKHAVGGTRVPAGGRKYTLDWAKEHNPPLVKIPRVVKVNRSSWVFQPYDDEKALAKSGNLANEEDEKVEEERQGQKEPRKKNESNLIKTFKPMHRAIAQKTIDECMRLRRLTGQPHFALAKAADTDQAAELFTLYCGCSKPLEMDNGYVLNLHSKNQTPKERQSELERLEKGEYIVCIVVGMLGEGYDNQLISVIAWHCYTTTHTCFYQFLGRGLRRLQFEYLTDKKLLGVCRKEDERDGGFSGPRWPPGDRELKEAKGQEDLVNEQECVMVVPEEYWSKLQNLYDDINGDMEGKGNDVESEKKSEKNNKRKRDDAVEDEAETENKRKSVSIRTSGNPTRQKLSEEEKIERRRKYQERLQRHLEAEKDAAKLDVYFRYDRPGSKLKKVIDDITHWRLKYPSNAADVDDDVASWESQLSDDSPLHKTLKELRDNHLKWLRWLYFRAACKLRMNSGGLGPKPSEWPDDERGDLEWETCTQWIHSAGLHGSRLGAGYLISLLRKEEDFVDICAIAATNEQNAALLQTFRSAVGVITADYNTGLSEWGKLAVP